MTNRITNTLVCLLVLFAGTAYASDYNRADFGAWQKGTRDTVIAKNTVQWVRCQYSGAVVPPEAIQIDHVVPVKVAWSLGANTWTPAMLHKFYNDPDNLVPVLAGINAAKGDKGPREWLPPSNRSAYLKSWHLICGRYGLNCDYGDNQ